MSKRTARTICPSACVVFIISAVAIPLAAQNRFVDIYAGPIQVILQESFAEGNAGMVMRLMDEHERKVFSALRLDNGTDQRIDADTVFEVGSVTKVFTSLLLLDAARRGEMRLDDPVANPRSREFASRLRTVERTRFGSWSLRPNSSS